MGNHLCCFEGPESCVEAQSSGLSASPTEENAGSQKGQGLNEGPVQVESKLNLLTVDEPKLITEEPESTDTSYGVEATAVRTLAASTGTVAILGTTAKVLETPEPPADLSIEERFKDNPSISVTKAEPENVDVQITDQNNLATISDQTKNHDLLENNVVQQKELKQIENEAIQEKQSELGRSSSSQNTSTEIRLPTETIHDESKTDKNTEQSIAEQSQEKLTQEPSLKSEPTLIACNTVGAPIKDESQLPKIVDYQEKSGVHVAFETEMSHEIQELVTKDMEDKEEKTPIKSQEKESEILSKPQEKESEALNEPQEKEAGTQIAQEKEADTPLQSQEREVKDQAGLSDFPAPAEKVITEEGLISPDEISPDDSKTEENDISSEQLKTNSLSDMSLSDALNSEGEEAVREAAKAQELQEMVASLSASATDSARDYRMTLAEASHSNEGIVGTSTRKSADMGLPTHETIVEEKISPEANEESNILHDLVIKANELCIQESPTEISDAASNESNPSSKQTEESKISDKEEITVMPTDEYLKSKKNENDTIEEKEKDEYESEIEVKIPQIFMEKNNEREARDEMPVEEEEKKIVTAATTIQSTFRGYKSRKEFKETVKNDMPKSINEYENKGPGIISDEINLVNLENIKHQAETNKLEDEGKSKEMPKDNGGINNNNEIIQVELTTLTGSIASAPESLVKIAQAEVDKICSEAEKTTESILTPPPVAIDPDKFEADYQDENDDFPAPPDDLLDFNEKNDMIKDDQESSGTEPTIPLGTNTDGDSSKTEDTTAPSFAESEVKSNEPSPSPHKKDEKLESSITDNMDTEVPVNRDSTEGELTMEEDSKEDDVGSVLTKGQYNAEKSEQSSMQGNEEKAATVIQATYRGFKTRQNLKKYEELSSENMTESQGNAKDETTPEYSQITENILTSPEENEPGKATGDISPMQDLSESKDDTSSTTYSEEELNEKACKIQAGVRGYLVRKEQKAKRDAAVKIQSTFRGFKARQRLKQEEST